MSTVLNRRLAAVEAAANARTAEQPDIIRVIVAPGRSVDGAFRRGIGGTLVPVSDDELAAIRRRRTMNAEG